jgi:hypothetical protein
MPRDLLEQLTPQRRAVARLGWRQQESKFNSAVAQLNNNVLNKHINKWQDASLTFLSFFLSFFF